MDTKNEKRSTKEEQPGSLSSHNNRSDNREGTVEEVKEEKSVEESYMDYNGNSEANAPARSRE